MEKFYKPHNSLKYVPSYLFLYAGIDFEQL